MQVAIYPGSFDPPTLGHLDVIQRALKLCSRLIIAIGENAEKTPLFSIHERVQLLRASTKGMPVDVESFQGLLADYARSKGVFLIIRSLREISDFSYEFQMSVTNRELEARLETIFLMTDKRYFYLNSSLVKDLAAKHADVSAFVPAPAADALRKKFPRK